MRGVVSRLFGISNNCNKQFPAQNSAELNGASGSKCKLIIIANNRGSVEQDHREGSDENSLNILIFLLPLGSDIGCQ